MEKLIIIDGNSIINRAYYGVRPLSTHSGIPTNAVFGFMNILLKYLTDIEPDYVIVAFDLPAPTFRHKKYASYKAQRKGMPDDLAQQLPHLKDVLDAMNILRIEREGYEADDIIGTVAKMCSENGVWCGIITGDRDDLQLAADNVCVLLTATRAGQTVTEELDRNGVIEKYGVTPEEYLQTKGLMGDASDNIPGVAGIGEKTAFSLIREYHSIENVYANLDNLTASVRTKLENGRDEAFLSLELATIDCGIPLGISMADAARREYDAKRLFDKLTLLEQKKIIERLNLTLPTPTVQRAVPSDGKDALKAIADTFEFILDGSVIFWHGGCFEADAESCKAIFENKDIRKITHDYKSVCHTLAQNGIELRGEYFDTLLAAYVLDPTRQRYDFYELCASQGAQSPKELSLRQLERINELGQHDLLYDIEFPLARVLYNMEMRGFCVDKAELERFGTLLGERIDALVKQIRMLTLSDINLNSTKQLGKLLFEDLGLPAIKKTKTGYCTDNTVLEKLRGKHPVIELLMEYRHISKLKSTYTDSLPPLIDENGRIHSSLNQTVTATGRISSSEPNLQNIPVRTPLGSELRKMFTAAEDSVLVGADYSQIELRLLAHLSNDAVMIEAFENDADIHTLTAAGVWNVPEFLVTSEMRSRAKTINFGVIYGQGEFSLAQELHITRREAKEYIENYFKRYDGVRRYMEETIEKAKHDGYVETIFHRRRHLPELTAANFNLRSFGERVARNTPIQGSAADIIKIAMVNTEKALARECAEARLIMQVHDELIVEAPKDKAPAAADILRREMENAAKLRVPLKADVKIGRSWYDTK
ncbi:MAG: DNA polymerase I [Clostridia bacterium]|nr:DNA polymerase I [Clostridia bacterium]